jgi:hypothetical protein
MLTSPANTVKRTPETSVYEVTVAAAKRLAIAMQRLVGAAHPIGGFGESDMLALSFTGADSF